LSPQSKGVSELSLLSAEEDYLKKDVFITNTEVFPFFHSSDAMIQKEYNIN